MSQWETLLARLAQHYFAKHEMGDEFRKPYNTQGTISFYLAVKLSNLGLNLGSKSDSRILKQ